MPAINENSENGLDEEPGMIPETTGREPTPSDVQPSTDGDVLKPVGALPKGVTFAPTAEEAVSEEVGTPPKTVGTESSPAGMQPDQTGI